MPTFKPPTYEGLPWALHPNKNDAENRLLRYYGGRLTGKTVWKDHEGTWHDSDYTVWGAEYVTFRNGAQISSSTLHDLFDAEFVFLGGHIYEVTQDVANQLIAAGYGDGITP
jgi:hypothetical protein